MATSPSPSPGSCWRASPPLSNTLPTDALGFSFLLSPLYLSFLVFFTPFCHVYWVRLGFHVFLSFHEWSPLAVRGLTANVWEIGADGFFCYKFLGLRFCLCLT